MFNLAIWHYFRDELTERLNPMLLDIGAGTVRYGCHSNEYMAPGNN
jgi:hypothetical protein